MTTVKTVSTAGTNRLLRDYWIPPPPPLSNLGWVVLFVTLDTVYTTGRQTRCLNNVWGRRMTVGNSKFATIIAQTKNFKNRAPHCAHVLFWWQSRVKQRLGLARSKGPSFTWRRKQNQLPICCVFSMKLHNDSTNIRISNYEYDWPSPKSIQK